MHEDLIRQHPQRLRLNNQTIAASHPEDMWFGRAGAGDEAVRDRDRSVLFADYVLECVGHFEVDGVDGFGSRWYRMCLKKMDGGGEID